MRQATAIKVVLYTRKRCHLCEVAKQTIDTCRSEFKFHFSEVNIDSHAALRKLYGYDVPVILLNGREIARHRLDPADFRRQLQAAAAGEGG